MRVQICKNNFRVKELHYSHSFKQPTLSPTKSWPIQVMSSWILLLIASMRLVTEIMQKIGLHNQWLMLVTVTKLKSPTPLNSWVTILLTWRRSKRFYFMIDKWCAFWYILYGHIVKFDLVSDRQISKSHFWNANFAIRIWSISHQVESSYPNSTPMQ